MNKRPLSQTLSKAFEISRNILLTAGLWSNAACISYIIESSWKIHESLDRKPDCEEVESFLLGKLLNRELQINLSKVLPMMEGKLIGR